MRRLWSILLMCVGCVPAFESVPCYGAGECPAPAFCVHRRCITPPTDMAVDATPRDAGPPDELRAVDGFGEGGLVGVPALANHDVQVARLMADGHLLIGGRSADGGFVTRLTPQGTLDPAFGDAGILGFAPADLSVVNDIIVTDERLLFMGTATPPGQSTLALQARRVDGALDTTFGDGGRFALRDATFGGADSFGRGVAITPGGRMVLVGASHVRDGDGISWALMLIRLLPDGRLDAAFGEGGVALQPDIERVRVTPDLVRLRADGRIFIGGSGVADAVCTAQLTVDGRFDATYGLNGIAAARADLGAAMLSVIGADLDAERVLLAVWGSEDGEGLGRLRALQPDGDLIADWMPPPRALPGGVTAALALQRHCDGVELGGTDGVIERWSLDGAPLARLSLPRAPDPDAKNRIFALAPGDWLWTTTTREGTTVRRLRATCHADAQGN